MLKLKNKILPELPLILTALLTGLIFPPFRSTYLIFFLLIPLISSLKKKPERAPVTGFVFGFFMTVTACYWIFFNSGAEPWVRIMSGFGLFVVNGLYYALFGFLYKQSSRLFAQNAVWAIPVLWAGMETSMLFEELAFPWTYIAHTLTDKTAFIQIAEFFGVVSVSMAVLYISILIFESASHFIRKDFIRTYTRLLTALLIFFGLLIFGHLRIGHIRDHLHNADTVRAALIHPGLDVEYKWQKENFADIINTQMRLSRESLSESPDLIIWGESNFPRYLENNPSYIGDFIIFAAENRTDLCIGSLGYDYFPETDSFKKYNSTFFFDQNKNMVRYDKRKLVPFGESFPFAWILTFLKDISLGQANFDKGTDNSPHIMTNGTLFHPIICYEALFPYYNAHLVRKGSQFMVNVSNDAWYENTSQVFQHSRFNVFRAIENRRSVFRLANKAESSVFLPTGEQRILFFNETNTQKTAAAPLNSRLTFFTLYGRYFAVMILLFNGAVLVAAWIFKGKTKPGSQ